MHKRNKGFGFSIDYDQAIAEDTREIARLSDPTFVALCKSIVQAEYTAACRKFPASFAWIDHLTYNVADERWRTAAERAPLLAIVGLTVVDLHALATFWDNDALTERLDVDLRPEERRTVRECYAHGKALDAAHSYLADPFAYMIDSARRERLSREKQALRRHTKNRALRGAR